MPILIRPIHEDDAAAYLELGLQLDRETQFLMLEPGERTQDVEEQRRRIRATLESQNRMTFVAEADGALVGVLGASGGAYHRNHDTVHIFIGILQAYTGQGIGRRLFEAAESWARGWGAHRLELTVMCHNERALALYRKMGFEMEGARRDSLKVDGQYIDEYAMAKILS